MDRSALIPGLLLAVRKVVNRPGLTVGIDSLLGSSRAGGEKDVVTDWVRAM